MTTTAEIFNKSVKSENVDKIINSRYSTNGDLYNIQVDSNSDDFTFTDSFSTFVTQFSIQTGEEEAVRITLSEKSIVETKTVNQLFKTGCLTILEDCTNKLAIMVSIHHQFIENVAPRCLNYQTIDDRFGGMGKNYNDIKINSRYTNYHKIQKEVKTLMMVFNKLYTEIDNFDTIYALNDYLENQLQMDEDDDELIAEFKRKQKQLRDLKMIYINEKRQKMREFQEFDKLAQDATILMKDVNEYAIAEVTFTKKWEGARFEQNDLFLNSSAQHFQNIATNATNNIKIEDRCHDEFKKYLLESQDDLGGEIQFWMEKYDREFEQKDNDIYDMKVQIDKIHEKIGELQDTIDKRNAEMEDWLEYKRMQKQAAERLVLQIVAATKIQTWWRSVMVRKKLGPYSKKKKKKDKGKKPKRK